MAFDASIRIYFTRLICSDGNARKRPIAKTAQTKVQNGHINQNGPNQYGP